MLRRLAIRHNVCQKLEKILPLVKENIPELSGMSLSSLVVATAFASSKFLAPTFHIPGCPFYSKQLPLTDLVGNTTAQANVCNACLRKTIHFLASEAFCDDMESRCVMENSEREQVPQQLLSKLSNDFGSFSSFVDNLLFFSTNQASPGRTWVVFNGEKIDTVNLSSNRVPLVYGLWPLALINMSERFLCSEILSLGTHVAPATHGVSQSLQPAFWSRASRNPFAWSSTSGQYSLGTSRASTANANEGLGEIRKKISQRAVNCMRWSFVNNQLIEATNYFSSPGRRTAQSEFRAKQEEKASLQALRSYKQSGDNIRHFSDTTDSTFSVTSNASERRGGESDPSRDASRSNPDGSDARTSAGCPVLHASERKLCQTKETLNQNETKEGASSEQRVSSPPFMEGADLETVAPSDSQSTKVVQHTDGSWEYQYQNGDRVFVYCDGTKVFKTGDVTTTVHIDGSTLFEYPNGSSILNRSDGIRVITYSDGTSKEEAIRPET